MKNHYNTGSMFRRTSATAISIVLFIFLTGNKLFSQQIQVILTQKTYLSGSNISCHGAADGEIDASIIHGTPPFSFAWSSGSTAQNLTGAGPGAYYLVVTDSTGLTDTSATVTLLEPDPLNVHLKAQRYFKSSYNISYNGGNDGVIEAWAKGGSAPYNYLYSNDSTNQKIDGLTAGTYSVTVTDNNGCVTTASRTLIQPDPIQFTSISSPATNGYNVPCAIPQKNKQGIINVTASGGIPPYFYVVADSFGIVYNSIGSTDTSATSSKSIRGLQAGYYLVGVVDQTFTVSNSFAIGNITLTKPDTLVANLTTSNYNGYAISCYNCYNGTITPTVSGGVAPYTYVWKSGQTTANISSLGAGEYGVIVTDANGCRVQNTTKLGQPGIGGWAFTGDNGDTTKFIGLVDNFPFIMKTNNTEQMRITETGNVGIGTTLSHNTNNYKLAVNGKIGAKEILIETNSDAWSDFVFEPTYKRLTLLEKEKYYTNEKHLPNITSANEIGTNGLDITKVMSGITQNVEENTLDIVELYKQLMDLKKENIELKQKMDGLTKK